MILAEFRIGGEFISDGRRWRCTDVGTRVVVAILVDEAKISTKPEGRPIMTRTVSGREAEAMGWFNGPPYGVVELVFDEDDIEGCEPA